MNVITAVKNSILQVNNNGIISFLAAVSTFTPDPFPIEGSPLIAPYWADVDTRGAGEESSNVSNTVWYRITTDPELRARAMAEIQLAFIDQSSFTPTFLVIATWEEVGYFSQNTDLVRYLGHLLYSCHTQGQILITILFYLC